jgi:hypothetical protein
MASPNCGNWLLDTFHGWHSVAIVDFGPRKNTESAGDAPLADPGSGPLDAPQSERTPKVLFVALVATMRADA